MSEQLYCISHKTGPFNKDGNGYAEHSLQFKDCKWESYDPKKHIENFDDYNIQSEKTKKKKIYKIKGNAGNTFFESIFVDGKPQFLCKSTTQEELFLKNKIETDDSIFKPLEQDQYGYEPYRFTSQEINDLKNKIPSKEDLFGQVYEQVNHFISATEISKTLTGGDIFLTYNMEHVDTLHYPFYVGENESGKSSNAHLFKNLAYRPIYGEDIPMADIYNFLGRDEEGCGTIIEDEAQDMVEDKEKMRMYKNSYSRGSTKARILSPDGADKKQVFYKTFALKVFAGESIPNNKGFRERLAVVHMLEGDPKGNIKRLTDEEKQKLYKIRNLLLVWKLHNVHKGLEKIESGLRQRDQELWEDFLRVAYGTKFYDKCKSVVAFYTSQRHESIKNSLEAKLFNIIVDNVNQSLEINAKDYWHKIVTDNPYISGNKHETQQSFYPDEFGQKITPHWLSGLLTDKFHGKKFDRNVLNENKRYSKQTFYSFNSDDLQRLVRKYGISLSLDSPIYMGQKGQKSLKDNADDLLDHFDPSGGQQIHLGTSQIWKVK